MTFSCSSITQWNDKSGNGYNATIAPNRVGATYSTAYNAVNFASSTTGYITNYSAAPTNETMFVVGNNPSPSGANNIIIGGVSGARSLGLGYSNPNGIGTIGNLNTQVAWLATIGGYTSGTTALVRSQFTPSSNSVAFNGGSPATGGAPGFTAGRVTYLGVDATDGYYHYNGYMMEALFYNRILTTTEIQQVEGYLAHKWGLTTYSPVTPLSIPGCSLWLDGADPAGTGVTPSNGATVSTWVDKSGNGRNGIQYSSFARPTFLTNSLNSRGGISFNAGSSQCYQTATILPTPRAVFVVGFTSDGGFCLSGIPTVNSGHPPYYISFARDVEYGVNNTSDTPHSTNVSTSYNTNYILTGLYTGSTVSVLINGGTLSNSVAFSGTPKTPAVTLIGINSYNGSLGAALTGTINEFIAFNVDITTTQRQSIEGYLARKWGFTSMYSALPSIHPAKTLHLSDEL